MFLLSKNIARQQSEEIFDDLYYELKCDLGLIATYGQESFDWMRAAGKTWSGIRYIAEKLQSITTRLFIMIRNTTEKVVMRYSSIMVRWDKRIHANLNRIDSNQFGARSVNVVPHELLMKRIDALTKLHHLLENIESICESPIASHEGDWRTVEIRMAYAVMQKIGFDADRFSLVGKVTAEYDSSRTKAPLSVHGYDLSSLREAIDKLRGLAKYAQADNVTKLSKRFVEYSDRLRNYEKSIEEEGPSREDYEQQTYILNIKLARLWWISHFIKASYVVANDICIDVLKICKVAELCITND